MRSSTFWTAVFTGILTLFTGLLLLVAMRQTTISRQSTELSRQSTESSRASQRAFLGIAISPRLEAVAPQGKVTGYKVHMGWKNNGTTPTQSALAEFNIADWAERPSRGFDFAQLPQAERQEYVVGPQASWEVLTVPLSFDMLSDGRHLFGWGWVVYRDIFKGTPVRLSEFCFELTNPKWLGPTGPVVGLDRLKPNTLFVLDTPPCQTHNCYDEQCEDYPKLAQLR
jgi:hypothetical protein